MKYQSFRAVALALAVAFATAPLVSLPAAAETAQTEESRARLVQYEPGVTDLAAIAAQETKAVVFFFATWCPNCILTLTELSEKWSDIEPDITVIIADYDTETDLKAKYGVTYQDTFVLLDKDANSAKLWNAGGVAGLNENTR
ncbi:TlpA family protein disulfide reductase [Aquamicrobium segne]|uniref:TlpA family protein disulfide reductase n=1 Tax=Aquamicrobium segne TaxID=469547 RepID=A0ABW0H2J7_9HYPH